MATSATPATEASTRLLRLVGLLVPHLDPVKGGKAKALGLVEDDLQELLDDENQALPAAVQSLLSSAITSLSSSAPSIPYSDCLIALSAITSALPLLVAPSSPPLPSPFSHLPAELVARVVDFCQDQDLRLRQNTNLALSRTCRALYAAVRPILRREVHHFTPGQLERIPAKVKADNEFKLGLREFTVQLELSEIREQKDGTWAGRHLLPLIWGLRRAERIHTLHLGFKDESGCEGGTEDFEESLFSALGTSAYDWERDFASGWHPRDRLVPALGRHTNLDFAIRALIRLVPSTERYQFGASAFPYLVDSAAFNQKIAAEVLHNPTLSFARLRALIIPFHVFHLQNLAVLSPQSGRPPSLQHLEIAVRIEDPAEDVKAVAVMLGSLTPSLRRLSLRFKASNGLDGSDFQPTLVDTLASLQLERLEIGGHLITERFFDGLATRLPSLRHLTALPMSDDAINHWEFEAVCCQRYSSLHTSSICTPDRASSGADDAWGARLVRQYIEEAEFCRIKLTLETRAAEYEWLEQE
ncbi:hypothetical protein JCM10213_006599 [Rhodosporidiobolus nylandii]